MTNYLRQRIAIPEFDPGRLYSDGHLLHVIALVMLALDIVVFVVITVVSPGVAPSAVAEMGLVAVGGLLTLIAARYQRPQLATLFLVGATWVVAAYVSVGDGRLNSPFLTVFIIPILLSFLLLERKARTLVLASTLLFVGTLWFLAVQAQLGSSSSASFPTPIWLGEAGIIALVIWLYSTAVTRAQQATRRVQEQERLLIERDAQLRQQIMELEKAEEAYHILVGNSVQGVAIVQNGHLVFSNRAHQELTGYSLDEFNRMEDLLTGYFHPDDRPLVQERMRARLEGQQPPSQYEVRIVRKDGAVRWVELSAARIAYHGEPAIQATCVDITERRQVQDALLASEAQFRTLTENAPIGVFMTDESGAIVYVNDELCRLVGWDPSELVGHPIARLIDEDEGDALASRLAGLEFGVANAPRRFVVRARHKDGTGFWGECSTNVIRDSSGANNTIGLLLDVTEHREAAQKQLELAVEKEKVEMLRQFIGNVSHDLKTPLTIINTSLYLLEKSNDPRRRAEKLEEIRLQAEQLGSMIQDLLAMSRLEQASELEFGPVRLDELAHEALRQFHLRFEAKSQTATIIVENGLLPALGDAGELKRLFCNLFENAINYTPAGGRIICTLAASGISVRLSVADTGIGIAHEELPHIFDRFYRSPRSRVVVSSGSGLGLAIVKKIVELHAGSIHVDSQPNVGTVFHITLPAARQVASV